MTTLRNLLLLTLLGIVSAPAQSPDEIRTSFPVKQVLGDSVYLEGGTSAGLVEGMRLTIMRLPPGRPSMEAETIAQVVVVAVASNSTLCEIRPPGAHILPGDTARLSPEDEQILRLKLTSQGAHHYAQVVTFTEGDPLEEEARASVPRPPLPEINRVRGRISYEYNTLRDRIAPAQVTVQHGAVVRLDITRIGGSYWNLTGYWRGRSNSRRVPAQQQTITDLVNRTYHIGAYYNNPASHYTAGFGRLLVPWASSLNTLDGGYFARRFGGHFTTGVFGGSTPDPTAWNYDPNRQIFGAFLNTEAGSFDAVKYTGTAGLAVTRLKWLAERQFAFFENSLFFKRTFSLYHNLEADQMVPGRLGNTESGARVSRSFLTVRWQPSERVAFDVNHNYFRNVPTFDTRLVATGLLDKFLFQGFSGGFRIQVVPRATVYANWGRSRRDGDAKASLNQMYGLTLSRLRAISGADLRYSRFHSSFGSGAYESLTVTRNIGERLRLNIQAGHQQFDSSLTSQSRASHVSADLDWSIGGHYFLGGGAMAYRGNTQKYDQVYFSLGYRF